MAESAEGVTRDVAIEAWFVSRRFYGKNDYRNALIALVGDLAERPWTARFGEDLQTWARRGRNYQPTDVDDTQAHLYELMDEFAAPLFAKAMDLARHTVELFVAECVGRRSGLSKAAIAKLRSRRAGLVRAARLAFTPFLDSESGTAGLLIAPTTTLDVPIQDCMSVLLQWVEEKFVITVDSDLDRRTLLEAVDAARARFAIAMPVLSDAEADATAKTHLAPELLRLQARAAERVPGVPSRSIGEVLGKAYLATHALIQHKARYGQPYDEVSLLTKVCRVALDEVRRPKPPRPPRPSRSARTRAPAPSAPNDATALPTAAPAGGFRDLISELHAIVGARQSRIWPALVAEKFLEDNLRVELWELLTAAAKGRADNADVAAMREAIRHWLASLPTAAATALDPTPSSEYEVIAANAWQTMVDARSRMMHGENQ